MTRRENGRANGASIDEELAGTFSFSFCCHSQVIVPIEMIRKPFVIGIRFPSVQINHYRW